MKLLRETIRRIILEDYELTDADVQTWKEFKDNDSIPAEFVKQIADLRGIGIQAPDYIRRDKNAMRKWHELMKQNPQFVNLFTKGKIQILHSLTYAGFHSDKADINNRGGRTPFTDWAKKFGTKSRDQISCIAANAPIGADPLFTEWDQGNAETVYTDGYGFLMKGYPAFVADYDVMSQTLSAIPQTLKDFHKNSGQVKRTSSMNDAIDLNSWLGAEEVILDNWQIIGVYIFEDYISYDLDNSPIVQDARKLRVPVYQMDTGTGTMKKI